MAKPKTRKKAGQTLTPQQRRNAASRKRGFKSYAAERLAKGIAKGKTPEQARGRPRSQQKRVVSKSVRKLIQKRIKAKSKGREEGIERFDFNGVPTKIRDMTIKRLMRSWDRRRNQVLVAYVQRIAKSKEYPNGYRQEAFFDWHEDEEMRAEFEDLLADGSIASVFEWKQ